LGMGENSRKSERAGLLPTSAHYYSESMLMSE